MSHSEFKDLILPTIQKSLLRSPENVIESRFLLRELLGGEGWLSGPVLLARPQDGLCWECGTCRSYPVGRLCVPVPVPECMHP